MNREELENEFDFKVRTEQWGARLPSDWYEDDVLLTGCLNDSRTLCDIFQRFFYRESTRVLHCDLIGDLIGVGTINARAFVYKGCDFIGIHLATLSAMRLVFMRLLANPAVRPDIGRSDLEDADRLPVPSFTLEGLQTAGPVLPNDRTRAGYACILFDTALHFIVGHEVGHIMNGHLPIGGDEHGSYLELDDDRLGRIAPVTSHALEMDADCVGIFGAQLMIKHRRAIGPAGRDELFALAYGSPENIYRTIVFAVYVVFRLFSGRYTDLSLERSHPPPMVRAYWAILCILERMQLDPFKIARPLDELKSMVFSWKFEAERACNAIVGQQNIDVEQLQRIAFAAEDYLTEKVKPQWTAIRPQLEPHVRGVSGLAP